MGGHLNRPLYNLEYSCSHFQLNLLPLFVSLSRTLALSAGRPTFEEDAYVRENSKRRAEPKSGGGVFVSVVRGPMRIAIGFVRGPGPASATRPSPGATANNSNFEN